MLQSSNGCMSIYYILFEHVTYSTAHVKDKRYYTCVFPTGDTRGSHILSLVHYGKNARHVFDAMLKHKGRIDFYISPLLTHQ